LVAARDGLCSTRLRARGRRGARAHDEEPLGSAGLGSPSSGSHRGRAEFVRDAQTSFAGPRFPRPHHAITRASTVPTSVGKAGRAHRSPRENRVVTWRDMALVDGDGISGIRFHGGHLGQFGRQPPKLGVARSNRARVTIWFRAASGLVPGSVAHQNTEPDRTISLYRFFGMVQISSVGFLPLSIWTN